MEVRNSTIEWDLIVRIEWGYEVGILGNNYTIRHKLDSSLKNSLNYAKCPNFNTQKVAGVSHPQKMPSFSCFFLPWLSLSMQIVKMGKESPSKVGLTWLKMRNPNSNPVVYHPFPEQNTAHTDTYSTYYHIYIM